MSFMRMFKSSKKVGNKENFPSSDRNSSQDSYVNEADASSKHHGSDVYTGSSRRSVIANPYSVITAPKKTKGPQSCPGAPMDDRRDRKSEGRLNEFGTKPFTDRCAQSNSVRYENLRGAASIRRTDNPDRSAHYAYCSNMDDMRNRNKPRDSRTHYYESYAESDEDDVRDVRINLLESKLAKMQRRHHEECKYLKRELEMSSEEIEHYKRNFERQTRAYFNTKRALEVEKHQVGRLKKALQQANNKIAELEERLSDACNDSSLLMCSYSSGLGAHASGAGEALCTLADPVVDLREMANSGTPSISMFPDMDEKEELDAQDEVRVFRTIEKDDGEEEEEDCASSPMEKPRKAISPVEMTYITGSPVVLHSKKPKLTRSLSYTDVSAIKVESDDPSVGSSVESRLACEDNIFDRTPSVSEATSDSSSDEEIYRVIERQLKKKGEVVKFQPPRAQVQSRHYKKFGKNERTALAEFEYLQDMSSDASGMLSSPDVAQYQQAMTMRR